MAQMKFTVLGASGFIGRHLVDELKKNDGAVIYAPNDQNRARVFDEVLKHELGNVFYCIGLTANFRSQPYDTVEAHVCLLKRLLKEANFESLTYLSSTRVYEGSSSTKESETLQVSTENPSHLYNLSKMLGESLCFSSGRKVRVARLSNVFGIDMPKTNFIGEIMNSAINTGRVDFQTTPESTKDYISIKDVIRWLPEIALRGRHTIYNVASGRNTSNHKISKFLEQKKIKVNFMKDAVTWSFREINIDRLVEEFNPPQHSLLNEFDDLFSGFSNHK